MNVKNILISLTAAAFMYMPALPQDREILRPHLDKIGLVVFTKHFDMGGSHYAYTEALSDKAFDERNHS